MWSYSWSHELNKSPQAENLSLADVIWERRIWVYSTKEETCWANGTKHTETWTVCQCRLCAMCMLVITENEILHLIYYKRVFLQDQFIGQTYFNIFYNNNTIQYSIINIIVTSEEWPDNEWIVNKLVLIFITFVVAATIKPQNTPNLKDWGLFVHIKYDYRRWIQTCGSHLS